MSELSDMAALIRLHGATRYRKVLQCSQDVADALAAVIPEAPSRMPGEPASLGELTGIDVVVVHGTWPGWYVLTRHDHCAIDAGSPGGVTHSGCTVLASSEQP